MLDGRTRVTVVGAQRRADLALPSEAPIAEYSAGLANLCGAGRGGAISPAWSLALVGRAPMPLTASLAEAGVVDGQVLYLRDVARDPGDDPTVAEIDEQLANEADDRRRAAWPRPFVVLSFSLAWLAATAGLALHHGDSAPLASAIGLVITGLLLLATAWALGQQRAVAPPLLRALTSITAVPCLAAGAALLGQALAGDDFRWPAAVCGAVAGVLMSFAATPEPAIMLLGLPLAVGALLAPLLLVVQATQAQVAAAVVIAMFSVLGLAKSAAALVTVWASRQPDDHARAGAATMMLIRWQRLLTVLLALPMLALAVAFVVLTRSGDGYALAMAATGSIALLVRAQQVGFTSELVPVGGAGLVGLYAVLVTFAERLWHSEVVSALVLMVGGLGLLGGAIIAGLLRHPEEPAAQAPPGFPPVGDRPSARRRLIDIVGVLCLIATVSLALGVFGVFDALMVMGRGIVG